MNSLVEMYAGRGNIGILKSASPPRVGGLEEVARKEDLVMKKHLLLLVTLLGASLMLVAPGSSTLFAKGGPPAWARGGDRDHGDQDHRGKKENRAKKENRGQRMKWERDHDGRYRFNDDARRAADDYYRGHRQEFREHWRNGGGPAIAYGYMIEPRYRRYCRPVPVVLMRELPPPPPGFRFYLFNGDVVLLDDGYRVQDFIHLDINIGR
jgi:hypothetical protein